MNKDIKKILDTAKEKGKINGCDKSRLLTMAEKDNVSASEIEKLLKGIEVKYKKGTKFNDDLYPNLATFDEAYGWIAKQLLVKIDTVGGKALPFTAKIKKNDILLIGNDQRQSQYLLTRAKWETFCKYVKSHPNMCRGELGENYKDYGCEDNRFHPAVIAISKACKNLENI